jgi:hypothetical protein
VDCCKLVRRIDKLLPDFVCKLGDGDEVSYTIAKAHRGPEYSVVIAPWEGKLPKRSCRIKHIIAVSLARQL